VKFYTPHRQKNAKTLNSLPKLNIELITPAVFLSGTERAAELNAYEPIPIKFPMRFWEVLRQIF